MIGRTISHYRVVGKLGVGGMGVVYDAEDEKLARKVALKFLPDELAGDPDATRRFRREAQTIALLNHPQHLHHLRSGRARGPHVHRHGAAGGHQSQDPHGAQDAGDAEIVDIAVQIAQALDAAHSKGVIHRDIKPGNIFISDTGRVKVLDFGLARRIPTGAPGVRDGGIDDAGPADRHGQLHGAGADSADAARSALRSVFAGVVMYEMATGRLPFAAASPAETVTNILEKEPAPVTALSPNLSGQLDRIVKKLLAKNAEDRYQTAQELRTGSRARQDAAAVPPARAPGQAHITVGVKVSSTLSHLTQICRCRCLSMTSSNVPSSAPFASSFAASRRLATS